MVKSSKPAATTAKISAKTIAKKEKPDLKHLWDRKKLAKGQFLSEVAYYCIKKINKQKVEVLSSIGGEITIDIDLLKIMDSAQHHAKDVPCSMTQLVEVLDHVNDTVFTVVFKK
jgi:hypothetical protein